MSLQERFKASLLLKGLCAISSIFHPLLNANTVAVPVGGPVFINPALTYPDPIYANLSTVMDNFFQPPYYPGNYNSPTYLSYIYYMSNAQMANGLIIDPFDSKIMHLSVGQNQIVDFTRTFRVPAVGTNTFATSLDGGATWTYQPSLEQPIPLGGTLSQLINASLGPGLYYEYAKDGTLHATGWGFFDMVANPPHLDPLCGFLSTTSLNNGQTWSPLEVTWPSTADFAFDNSRYFRIGPGITGNFLREFYTTIDPSDSNIIHASTACWKAFPTLITQIDAAFIPGTIIYYYKSEDGGKTFSAPVVAYSLMDDPDWREKYFDADYGINLEYLNSGGISQIVAHPKVIDKDVIVIPAFFFFPKQGTTRELLYSQRVYTFGLIRSADGGKTWNKCASLCEPSPMYSPFVTDPGVVDPFNFTIEGNRTFPFFFENSVLFSRSQAVEQIVYVSASTGRVYIVRMGGKVQEEAPNGKIKSTAVAAYASNDKGETWTPGVQVNRTPSDILPGAQQVLAQGAALSKDGWLAVAYYDFRNWTGYPGELYDNIDPETAPPLQADAWLALYRETSDPAGGSTGIGLDFVEEIRLTPESFNARQAAMTTTPPYSILFATGTPEGIALAFNGNNELYVVYGTQTSDGAAIYTNDYKGMTVDLNHYYNIYLQRFKFSKSTDQ